MLKSITGRRQALFWLLALTLLTTSSLWLISPWGQAVEEGLGLDTLFRLRGQRPTPANVAIVAIGEHSAATLGLPEHLPDWPRSVHAQLVQNLNTLGARLIAFDVFFKQRGDAQADQQFADALQEAGNVILFASTRRQFSTLGEQQLQLDSIVEPLPLLQQAALTTAPFMLPKVSSKVTRFWIRRPGHPPRGTLPSIVLQQLGEPQQTSASLAAMNNTQVYNYYGPPRSFTTVALEELLLQPQKFKQSFHDAIVFVGYSALYQPGQRDGFYTPYTASSGLDISGVELAATAFANLQESSVIRYHLYLWVAALLVYGGLLLIVGLRLPMAWGVLIIAALAMAYLALANLLFRHQFLWLPLVTPLLLLTPLAIITAAWHRVSLVGEQKQRLETTFGHYLPAAEIRRLASHPERFAERETLFGVCLVTDAQGYTRLSESLGAERMSELMEHYYSAVIEPIRQHGGIISDVAGDGVVAIWPHIAADAVWPSLAPALEALQASIDRFNRQHPRSQLPTRIGVHAGEVVMGHFGASDHFQFRAIGDLVNTTSRIENAGKAIGASPLLSSVCVPEHADQLRCLGHFLLSGKQEPITLFSPYPSGWTTELEGRFHGALKQLASGQLAEGRDALARLQRESGDTVCDFYLNYCQSSDWHELQQVGAKFIVHLSKS